MPAPKRELSWVFHLSCIYLLDNCPKLSNIHDCSNQTRKLSNDLLQMSKHDPEDKKLNLIETCSWKFHYPDSPWWRWRHDKMPQQQKWYTYPEKRNQSALYWGSPISRDPQIQCTCRNLAWKAELESSTCIPNLCIDVLEEEYHGFRDFILRFSEYLCKSVHWFWPPSLFFFRLEVEGFSFFGV